MTEEAKFGLIGKNIEGDNELLKFRVLKSAKTYTKVKEACHDYADNRGVFGSQEVKEDVKEKKEDAIEKLRKQMGEVKIFIAEAKKAGPSKKTRNDIICRRCNQPGHFTYQCQLSPRESMKCNYCVKTGHSEHACCTKQADERARDRVRQNGAADCHDPQE